MFCCCSAANLCLTLYDHMDYSTPGSCLPLSTRFCSNLRPLIRWCYLVISSSAASFSSCSHFPSIRVFSGELLFASAGQSIGVSASASVLPMNIQGWFSLRLTGLISLQSKGLSRVFSSTIIQKHQFFEAQSSLWSNFHICTWLLENPVLTIWTFVGKVVSAF